MTNSSDEVVSRVPRSGTAFSKTFYDRPDYQISAGVNDDKRHGYDKDAAKMMNENRSKVEQSAKQKEAIAKYGNQQPEKNDEQRIAEKARGQYIREEQAAQRKQELERKKQALLNKAQDERTKRYLKDTPIDYKARHDELARKTAGGHDFVEYINDDGTPHMYRYNDKNTSSSNDNKPTTVKKPRN